MLPRTDRVIRFDARSRDTEEKINSSQASPQFDTSESWGINKLHGEDAGNSFTVLVGYLSGGESIFNHVRKSRT